VRWPVAVRHQLATVAAASLAAALAAQNQALQLTTGVLGAVDVPYDP
jgi:hypothetical protein